MAAAKPQHPHCHRCGDTLRTMRVNVYFCHKCQHPFVDSHPPPLKRFVVIDGLLHRRCDTTDHSSFWGGYDQLYCTGCEEPRSETPVQSRSMEAGG